MARRTGRSGGGIVARHPGRSGRRSPAPPGIDLVEVQGWPGQEALGVVRDRRWGTWAAVVPVEGGSFVLQDGAGQIEKLEAWRAVLGTLARPGTPLRRIQWVHRSAPAVDLPSATQTWLPARP